MKTVLYMHTGSGNHGCEALVRTTSKLLGGPAKVDLWSLNKNEDIKYGISECVGTIIESEAIKRGSISHFEAAFRRKILKQSDAIRNIFLRNTFKNNIAISIGGDNYCYPWSAKQGVELDRIIRKYCKKNVLWGCSIDSEAVTDEMIEDLKGFDLITARESLTYDLVKKINPHTVKVADPAFLLERVDLPLPENFKEGNTVGINISPMIMKYGTEENLILENYREMIRYIIENTDMNICLIPHVVWEYTDDCQPINILYQEWKESKRICKIVDCNCQELKGFIARCRYFVGARTHATIAAYSSCVPTLVVGYSVKSRGIAIDLFGTEDNYVCSVQNMHKSSDLLNSFMWLMQKEKNIKNMLEAVIPEYKMEALKAVEALNDIVI